MQIIFLKYFNNYRAHSKSEILEVCIRNLQIIIITVLTIFFLFGVLPAYGGLSLTIVYDNSPYRDGLTAGNGFSCLVKIGPEKILFDTGENSAILLSNMHQLGIDLKTINTVVISHLHEDHIGGLFSVLNIQPNARVFLPKMTPEIQQMFQTIGTKNIIVEKPMQINKYLFLTGEMGTGTREQSLIINTPYGLIIIAGCSHPGITNVIRRAKELLNRPVYLVIGGFHTMPETTDGMMKIIQEFKSLRVKKVGPAHCTPEKAKIFFKAAYKKNYITMGVGKKINLFRKKTKY